jgi:hypothetical protein
MAYNNSKQKLISETLCKKKKQTRGRTSWLGRAEGLAERSKNKTWRKRRLKAGRAGRSMEQEAGGAIGKE